MAEGGFIKGIAGWPWPPRTLRTVELATDKIIQTRRGEKNMADIVDDLKAVLTEHAQAISTIEGFMQQHAQKATAGVDPMRLQEVLELIKGQTTRLAAILEKYPIVP